MAKPRAKTLQERMGFMEDDLTTPGHDAIMLWLDANMEAYLQEWLGFKTWTSPTRQLMEELSIQWQHYIRWTTAVANKAQEILHKPCKDEQNNDEDRVQAAIRFMNGTEERERYRREQEETQRIEAQSLLPRITQVLTNPQIPLSLPPYPRIKVMKKIWEHPLTTQREYTIGFIDLVVSWGRPRLDYDLPPSGMVWIDRQGSWHWNEDGVWDEWRPTWVIDFEKHEVAFEVKTTIPSLGELLRQLKLYEQHFSGKIFVVAPDARFAEKIREQGFGFIQSPSHL